MQVVVEKAPKSSIQDIDKRKFLVPSDLTGNETFVKQEIDKTVQIVFVISFKLKNGASPLLPQFKNFSSIHTFVLICVSRIYTRPTIILLVTLFLFFFPQWHSLCTSSGREFSFLQKKRCFFSSIKFYQQQGLFRSHLLAFK